MNKKQGIMVFFVIFLFFTFCGRSIPQFNGENAFSYLQKQCEFGPRVPGSETAKQCLQFIKLELVKFTEHVVEQKFQYYDKIREKNLLMTNLLASFNPEKKQRVFLAAHWDSRPTADRDPNMENQIKPIIGANDGASGVAVLLEIARNLKKKPPSVGIDLILFDGEDYGREGHLEEYFLGSRYFAEQAGNYRPKYGILLDMVGDAQLSIPIEGYSQQYLPHIVDKIWQTAESLGYFQFERRVGEYINDDHRMLIDKGIPCIDIIDFDYSYWHTMADTPDKCTPQSLEAVGTVVLHVIYNEEM
jgi:glutaminyl-peptide cyclotransferase